MRDEFLILYELYQLGPHVFPFDLCIASAHFLDEMMDSNYSWRDVSVIYNTGIWVPSPDGRWHIATPENEIVVRPIDDRTFELVTVFPIHESRWFRLLDLAAMEWWAMDLTVVA